MTRQPATTWVGGVNPYGDVLPQRVREKTAPKAGNLTPTGRPRRHLPGSVLKYRSDVVLELVKAGRVALRDLPALTGWDSKCCQRTAKYLIENGRIVSVIRGVYCIPGAEAETMTLMTTPRDHCSGRGSVVNDATKANPNSIFDLPRMLSAKVAVFQVVQIDEESEDSL